MDLDKDNILLIIYSDTQEQKENNHFNDIVRSNYFSFLNKNKFIIEEKKINFRKKIIYENSKFFKIDNNQIYYNGDIWYYLYKEKYLIKINYIDNYFCNFDYYFINNGNINFIIQHYYNNWYLYENNNNIDFMLQANTTKDYFDPEFNVKRYKNMNIKNKILTCPFCPLIPYFYIYNDIIIIKCKIHKKIKYHFYEFNDFINNYNVLDLSNCDFCGTKDNLFYCKEEQIYICENCMKDSKDNIKDKIIDMNNIRKCIEHTEDVKYTYNFCEKCLEDNNRDKGVIQLIKKRPEKLENILFSEFELNELKEQIKAIETKIDKYFDLYNNDISSNYNREYFKHLYLFINIYSSFIYTYEYLSKKNCLNYSAVKNLRSIQLLPYFDIEKKEIFFKNISIKRFLNGRINKKYEDEMLKYIYDNCDKYDRKYSLKYDKTIEKVGNIYYKNNFNKYVYIYSEKKLYESNLDELIAKIDKYIIFKIKNINYLCLCTETEIQILSFTINNEKCYIKLYQTIKFKQKNNLHHWHKCQRYYIQEDSKIYLLYESKLIIISYNDLYFQIDAIIKYDNNNYLFVDFDKYKNKIFILLQKGEEEEEEEEEEKSYNFIEINLTNYKIKFWKNIFENIISFIIINQYMFLIKEEKENCLFYIYDINKFNEINSMKLLDHHWIIQKSIRKNVLILIKSKDYNIDKELFYLEFWKIENNNLLYLNKRKHIFSFISLNF